MAVLTTASGAESGVRSLATITRCSRCRQDRQKCERPNTSQKCLRCARYNHECDESRVSNRAQQGRSQQHARRRAAQRERTIHRPHTAQYDISAVLGQLRSDSGASSVCVRQSASPRSCRSTSSELSTSLATPNSQDCLSLHFFSDEMQSRERRDSLYPSTCSPGGQWSDMSEASFGQDSTLGWDTFGQSEVEVAFTAVGKASQWTEHPELGSLTIIAPARAASAEPPLEIAFPPLSGLTNIRPSRLRQPSPMEARLENRVERLWDSFKAFAMARREAFAMAALGKKVPTPPPTLRFGRTFSELFRLSKTLAEGGNEMVSLTRYACGAADACMNPKLPASTRAEFMKAYNYYDSRARTKLWQAVHDFDVRVHRAEAVDVLPLYIATFLYHAAGACIRGNIDIDAVIAAFDYYNKFTSVFPIVVKRSSTPDGKWAVDMLLANNSDDPGMRISSLMFALGKVRLKFDREEGLC